MKLLESSPPNFFPISTDSSMETFGGMSSLYKISKAASLNMHLSSRGIRSIRQFLEDCLIILSRSSLFSQTPKTSSFEKALLDSEEAKFR